MLCVCVCVCVRARARARSVTRTHCLWLSLQVQVWADKQREKSGRWGKLRLGSARREKARIRSIFHSHVCMQYISIECT